MRVLVTGCAGEIGLGIGRILKSEKITTDNIGCDIHEDHAGIFIFDKVELVPRADSCEYIDAINSLIKKYSIRFVIPTSEPELRILAKDDNFKKIAAKIIIANPEALQIGFDKLKTSQMLKVNNLPFPWTIPVNEGNPKELPCIIKGRHGSGSRNISIVDNKYMVEFYLNHRKQDIWQEYLINDDEEYTCAIFRSQSGETRTLVIKRVLRSGHTVSGEVVENKAINNLLDSIADILKINGSINVQLRLVNEEPMIFEINPRFSSTVVFRHMLGFKDLIWCIEDKEGKTISKYIPPKVGTRFYRGDAEYIKFPDYS